MQEISLVDNQRRCRSCDTPFLPKNRPQQYCSRTCGQRARFITARVWIPVCPQCQQPFRVTQKRVGQIYCSRACLVAARRPMQEMRACVVCQTVFTLAPWTPGRRYCSRHCREVLRDGSRETRACQQCGTPYLQTPMRRDNSRFCSQSCAARWHLAQPEHRARVYTPESREKTRAGLQAWWAQETPAVDAARQRMKGLRARQGAETIEKMKATLHRIGHRPIVQGGNGRGLTVPQRLLSEALGTPWQTEVVVPTGLKGKGLPKCYILDLANLYLRLAVEVDGPTHQAIRVRQRDQRKDAFLTANGWTVFRFGNQEILHSLPTVLATIQSQRGGMS